MNKENNNHNFKINDLAIVRYINGHSIGVIIKIENENDLTFQSELYGNRTITMRIILSTQEGYIGKEYTYQPSILEPFDENTIL